MLFDSSINYPKGPKLSFFFLKGTTTHASAINLNAQESGIPGWWSFCYQSVNFTAIVNDIQKSHSADIIF